MFNTIEKIWNLPDLRKKILFTIGILVLVRVLAHVTVPGINPAALDGLTGGALGVFSLFTGGALENFSIILMGLSPYINASIIIQLMTVISPQLESLSKEGEEGRRKINQYTRYLTVPLAFVQSFGMILLLNRSAGGSLISDTGDWTVMLPIMLTITAGTILIMWLGELISEKGIGNGISILIFAGIVAGIPQQVWQNLSKSVAGASYTPFVILVIITVLLTIAIVLVSEGERRIPVTYAGRQSQASVISTLPIRINQAGMIPIIFAVSIIVFPSILASFFRDASSPLLRSFAEAFANPVAQTSWLYIASYFVLVMAFTFFYVSITFNPEQVAENIQKRGGFVAGYRPGRETSQYLGAVSRRLTLWGGVFLGSVAVIPMVLQRAFQEFNLGVITLVVSGAGLIIIVGVVLEIIRQVNDHLRMHDYNKLY